MLEIQKIPLVGSKGAQVVDDLKRAQKQFDQMVLSTRAFNIETVKMSDSLERTANLLQQGKLRIHDYFQIWRDQSKGTSKLLDDISNQQARISKSFVIPDLLKPGYTKVITNLTASIKDLGAEAEAAAIKTKLMNSVIRDGANQLINLGKNTQWAGRQLTVGLTVPLAAFGAQAAKAFNDVDKELTRMSKVYGDGLTVTSQQTIDVIRKQTIALAQDLAKTYGMAAQTTAQTAADLAATGLQGQQLLDATRQTMRLATLGELDQQSAMKATIALQRTFKLSSQELGDAVNYLNAVENQTSTSLADLVEALPRAGTIVQELGGNFKDLSVMMVAMREAGVPAAEAANSIKSAMASIINPSKTAREDLKKFGIDIGNITTKNAGDLVGTIEELQKALDGIDPLNRTRMIEELFGKFQFAKVAALLDNLGKVGSQTQKAFELAHASSSQLANLAAQELKQQTESVSGQWNKAIQTIKADFLPIGQQVVKVGTVILKVFSKVIEIIDKLGPLKNILGTLFGGVAIVGPLLMISGIFINLIGQMAKAANYFRMFREGFQQTGTLAGGFKNLSNFFEVIDKSTLAATEGMSDLATSTNNTLEAFAKLTDQVIMLKNRIDAIAGNPLVFVDPQTQAAMENYSNMTHEQMIQIAPYYGKGEQIAGVERPHQFAARSLEKAYQSSDKSQYPTLQHYEQVMGPTAFSAYIRKGLSAQYSMASQGAAATLQREYSTTPVVYGGPSGQSKEDVFARETKRLIEIHDKILSGQSNADEKTVAQLTQILGSSALGDTEAAYAKILADEPAKLAQLHDIVGQVVFSFDNFVTSHTEKLVNLNAALHASEGTLEQLNVDLKRAYTTDNLSATEIAAAVKNAWSAFHSNLMAELAGDAAILQDLARFRSTTSGALSGVTDIATAALRSAEIQSTLAARAEAAGGKYRKLLGPNLSMDAGIVGQSLSHITSAPYTPPTTPGLATGGHVTGPGGPTDDKIPAYLSNGEYVIRASSVNKYGKDTLDAINTQKFANGGIAGYSKGVGPWWKRANSEQRTESGYLDYNPINEVDPYILTPERIPYDPNSARPGVAPSFIGPLPWEYFMVGQDRQGMTDSFDRYASPYPFTTREEAFHFAQFSNRQYRDDLFKSVRAKHGAELSDMEIFAILRKEQGAFGGTFPRTSTWETNPQHGIVRHVVDPVQGALESWFEGNQDEFRNTARGKTKNSKMIEGMLSRLSPKSLLRGVGLLSPGAYNGGRDTSNLYERGTIDQFGDTSLQGDMQKAFRSGDYLSLIGREVALPGLTSWSESIKDTRLMSRFMYQVEKLDKQGNALFDPLLIEMATRPDQMGLEAAKLIKKPMSGGVPIDEEVKRSQENILADAIGRIIGVSQDIDTRAIKIHLAKNGGPIGMYLGGDVAKEYKSQAEGIGGLRSIKTKSNLKKISTGMGHLGFDAISRAIFDRSGKFIPQNPTDNPRVQGWHDLIDYYYSASGHSSKIDLAKALSSTGRSGPGAKVSMHIEHQEPLTQRGSIWSRLFANKSLEGGRPFTKKALGRSYKSLPTMTMIQSDNFNTGVVTGSGQIQDMLPPHWTQMTGLLRFLANQGVNSKEAIKIAQKSADDIYMHAKFYGGPFTERGFGALAHRASFNAVRMAKGGIAGFSGLPGTPDQPVNVRGITALYEKIMAKRGSSAFESEPIRPVEDMPSPTSLSKLILRGLFHGTTTQANLPEFLTSRGGVQSHNLFGADFFTTSDRSLAENDYTAKSIQEAAEAGIKGVAPAVYKVMSAPPGSMLSLDENGASIMAQSPALFKFIYTELARKHHETLSKPKFLAGDLLRFMKRRHGVLPFEMTPKTTMSIYDTVFGNSQSENSPFFQSEWEAYAAEKGIPAHRPDLWKSTLIKERLAKFLLSEGGPDTYRRVLGAGSRTAETSTLFNDEYMRGAALNAGFKGVTHTGGIMTNNDILHNVAAWWDPTYVQVKKLASGGKIFGAGGPTDDKIPAYLSNGEFVMNAKSVQKYGAGFMDKLNTGTAKFAQGGIIGLRRGGNPAYEEYKRLRTLGVPIQEALNQTGLSASDVSNFRKKENSSNSERKTLRDRFRRDPDKPTKPINPMRGMGVMMGVQSLQMIPGVGAAINENKMASGVMAGVQLGGSFGPYGMAIGAALGGLYGLYQKHAEDMKRVSAGIKSALSPSAEILAQFGVKVRDFSGVALLASQGMGKASSQLTTLVESLKASQDPDTQSAIADLKEAAKNKDTGKIQALAAARYGSLKDTIGAKNAKDVTQAYLMSAGISGLTLATSVGKATNIKTPQDYLSSQFGAMTQTQIGGKQIFGGRGVGMRTVGSQAGYDPTQVATFATSLMKTGSVTQIEDAMNAIKKNKMQLDSFNNSWDKFNEGLKTSDPELAKIDETFHGMGLQMTEIVRLNVLMANGFQMTAAQAKGLAGVEGAIAGADKIAQIKEKAKSTFAGLFSGTTTGGGGGGGNAGAGTQRHIDALQKEQKAIQDNMAARQKSFDLGQQEIQQQQTLEQLRGEISRAGAAGDLIALSQAQSNYNVELAKQQQIKDKQTADDADQAKIDSLQKTIDALQKKLSKLQSGSSAAAAATGDLSQAQQTLQDKIDAAINDGTWTTQKSLIDDITERLGGADGMKKALDDAGVSFDGLSTKVKEFATSPEGKQLASANGWVSKFGDIWGNANLTSASKQQIQQLAQGMLINYIEKNNEATPDDIKKQFTKYVTLLSGIFGVSVPKTAKGPGNKALPVDFATGGYISGPGGPKSDMIPAMLSNGEYVVNAGAVSQYGISMLDALNSKRYAVGGFAGTPKISSGGNAGSSLSHNAVYNINVNVAGSNSSAEEIAKQVMKTIQREQRSMSTGRTMGGM